MLLSSGGARDDRQASTVGATFDPGPEFAYSDFKYHRHPEVASEMMGAHHLGQLHGEAEGG